jgi:outer membrane protein OmpA-like peptidoglycan-associated protein
MDVGVPWLYPYVGGGVGYAWTHLNNFTVTPSAPPLGVVRSNGTEGSLAYQAIAGLAFPIPNVPGLSLTAEYRFFGITGGQSYSATITPPGGPFPMKLNQQYSNNFLFGVRYAFGVAAPQPVAAPAPVPAQAPARSYLVFFDWDKATLTDRARQIIKEAADNSTHVQYTRIEVNGYTDTSGTPQYNMGLSIRRANAVKAELIKDGVPANAITTQGFGETHLLVPTGAGVREPQNRRVEIIIR